MRHEQYDRSRISPALDSLKGAAAFLGEAAVIIGAALENHAPFLQRLEGLRTRAPEFLLLHQILSRDEGQRFLHAGRERKDVLVVHRTSPHPSSGELLRTPTASHAI